MNFKDKVVLVTGAAKGIGQGIAKAFANLDAKIVIMDYAGKEEAEQFLKESNIDGLVVMGDVSKLEDCENAVTQALEKFGKIDILINNAGITRDNLMLRMNEADFDSVIAVNLKGAWNMIKATTRSFLKQKSGRIINISSVVGMMGNAGQANYSASKAGLLGLTKSVAKEFAPRGITVNAIAPGFIQTDMTDKLTDEIKEYYLKNIPLNSLGTIDDIANASLFLASDMAQYITGQTLNVNGGLAMY